VTKPVSNPPKKPLLDEESFQQLLAAASVIQEHRNNLTSAESDGDFTFVLSQIIETGGLLQKQKPDLGNAARIIVEQAQKAVDASGVAIGLLERGQVAYLAATGTAACDLGSRVTPKLCLGGDCFIKQRTLKFIAGEHSESQAISLLKQRGLRALIAAPLWCRGAVAGIVELRFVTAGACNEGAVRAAELFAGLASIVLLSAKQSSVDSDSWPSANLEHVKSSPDREAVRVDTGPELSSADHLSSSVEAAEKNTEAAPPISPPDADIRFSKTKPALEPAVRILPATETVPANELDAHAWTSAGKARQWLDNLRGQQKPGFAWVRRLWETRRATIYVAVAGLILLVTLLQVGFSTGPSRPAVAVAGKSRRHKAAPLHLTIFEELLVSLGLAEPPPAPTYRGNPNVQVWVDIHTALYYCPGADLYGKTNGGRFSTQLEAQQDQFEPANREVCD
jgi:hypothetical protein